MAGLSRGRQVVEVGLDDVDSPRFAATLHGVDQDQPVVAVEQLVGQVHAADSEVDHLDPARQGWARVRGEPGGHLHAEAVVAEEDVPDARDQDAGHGLSPNSSTSSGTKYR